MPSKNQTHVAVTRQCKERLLNVVQRLNDYLAGGRTLPFEVTPEWGVTCGQAVDYLIDQWERHHARAARSAAKKRDGRVGQDAQTVPPPPGHEVKNP